MMNKLNQPKHIYSIINDMINFDELKIDDFHIVNDESSKNEFIIFGLKNNKTKFLFETDFLHVNKNEQITNKFFVELPKTHINYLTLLDNTCLNLLDEFINNNLDSMNFLEITDIQYIPLISEINKINTFLQNDDTNVKFIFKLDYISLLIDGKNLIAKTKIQIDSIIPQVHMLSNFIETNNKIINEEILKSDNEIINEEILETNNEIINEEILESDNKINNKLISKSNEKPKKSSIKNTNIKKTSKKVKINVDIEQTQINKPKKIQTRKKTLK